MYCICCLVKLIIQSSMFIWICYGHYALIIAKLGGATYFSLNNNINKNFELIIAELGGATHFSSHNDINKNYALITAELGGATYISSNNDIDKNYALIIAELGDIFLHITIKKNFSCDSKN